MCRVLSVVFLFLIVGYVSCQSDAVEETTTANETAPDDETLNDTENDDPTTQAPPQTSNRPTAGNRPQIPQFPFGQFLPFLQNFGIGRQRRTNQQSGSEGQGFPDFINQYVDVGLQQFENGAGRIPGQFRPFIDPFIALIPRGNQQQQQ